MPRFNHVIATACPPGNFTLLKFYISKPKIFTGGGKSHFLRLAMDPTSLIHCESLRVREMLQNSVMCSITFGSPTQILQGDEHTLINIRLLYSYASTSLHIVGK